MKISSRPLVLSLLLFPFLVEFAQAQGTLRRFDDLTFTALTAARDLRWELHDEFAQSRDQMNLLKDTDSLISDLHGIHRQIYDRRSPQELDRELDHAIQHAAELRRHLLACDFYQSRPVSYQRNAKGYTFQPETRHPGRGHVDHALQMLSGIEGNLTVLHRELMAVAPVHRPGAVVPGGAAPRPGMGSGFPASVKPVQVPVLYHKGVQLQIGK